MQEAGGRGARIIDSLEAASDMLAPLFAGARAERLVVAHLDLNSRVTGVRISYAPMDEPIGVPVRAIIADALGLGSASLILAHNHPSGDATPSSADIEATRSLVQAARPLGLVVRDHLVFGGGSFVSFRQRGLL
jgi:DNA repair protein RadC